MKDFSTLKVGDKLKSKVRNETWVCVEFEGDKVLMRDPHPFPYGIPLFMLDALNPNDWELIEC